MKKIKPLGEGSFRSKLLRLLGKDRAFELPLHSQEEVHAGISANYTHSGYYSEIKNALLEAEQDKSHGIMEFRRRYVT